MPMKPTIGSLPAGAGRTALFIEAIGNHQHANAGSNATKFFSLNCRGSPEAPNTFFKKDALLSAAREVICIESEATSTSFKIHEGGAELRQNVSRIDDHAETVSAERSACSA